MLALFYGLPVAALWMVWLWVHWGSGWWAVFDYIAFGAATLATGFLLVVAAINAGMRR